MKTKHSFIYLLALILLSNFLFAQPAYFQWAQQHEGGDSGGASVATDAAGNVYTTGGFIDTVDVDPGAGVSRLISNGSSDMYITKQDAAGNLIWAQRIGGIDSDNGIKIIVDASGNVYVLGSYKGSVNLNQTTGLFMANGIGYYNYFVLKLNAAGNFLWAKTLDALNGNSGALVYSMAVDVSGSVFLTGIYEGTIDFDPGTGTYVRTAPPGSSIIYFCKLNSQGIYMWTKFLDGGPAYTGNYSYDIAIDNAGALYATGEFVSTLDFDPGNTVVSISPAGYRDVFILKLSSTGSFIWAKNIGAQNGDITGNYISIDGLGNVYLSGQLKGTADFDPGAATYSLASSGVSDMFISKLDATGNFIWAKRIGGTHLVNNWHMTTDAAGNVYTTGNYQDTVDFDPGAGVFNLNGTGDYDIFISKLNANGNFVWAHAVNGPQGKTGASIALFHPDVMYVTGWFDSSCDFNFDAATFNLAPTRQRSAFLMKLDGSPATGIKQEAELKSARLYPNPFNASAVIELNASLNNSELQIYDLSGRKITTQIISGGKAQIERGSMGAGAYYYQVKQDEKMISAGKFIITD